MKTRIACIVSFLVVAPPHRRPHRQGCKDHLLFPTRMPDYSSPIARRRNSTPMITPGREKAGRRKIHYIA
jgi:hypothetical protein